MAILSLNDHNFKQEVLDSKVLVVVDFFAQWCGPCKLIKPILEELSKEYADKCKICKLDVDEAQGIAAQLGIMSIPTLLFFKSGKKIDQIIGAVPKDKIKNLIDKSLA